MAHKLANMVKQTGTSAGATALTLTGAPVSPYRAFSAVLSDGDTTEAMVIDRGGGQWQAAIYSYAADVLTFVELIDSPTGAPIDFPAGLKDVFIAPLALAASNDGIGWTEFGIVAAGNSQGTAATLAADKLCHVIDGTTTLGGAVVLPSATGAAGDRPHTIININPTEFDVGVYPSSGESIYPLADNISALINAGGIITYTPIAPGLYMSDATPVPVAPPLYRRPRDKTVYVDIAAIGDALFGSAPQMIDLATAGLTFRPETLGDWNAAAFTIVGKIYRLGPFYIGTMRVEGTPAPFTAAATGPLGVYNFPVIGLTYSTFSMYQVDGFSPWPEGTTGAHIRMIGNRLNLSINRINSPPTAFDTTSVLAGRALAFSVNFAGLVN